MTDPLVVLPRVKGTLRAQKVMLILSRHYPNIRFTQLYVKWEGNDPYIDIRAEAKYHDHRIPVSTHKEVCTYAQGVLDTISVHQL